MGAQTSISGVGIGTGVGMADVNDRQWQTHL